MEIYNETVNDLLDPNKTNLEIRGDKNSVIVENLTKVQVKSLDDIIGLINKGNEVRKMGQHKMSDQTSRSHTIFRFELQVSEKNTQTSRKIINTSEINLVDLAGSEGVAKCGH